MMKMIFSKKTKKSELTSSIKIQTSNIDYTRRNQMKSTVTMDKIIKKPCSSCK